MPACSASVETVPLTREEGGRGQGEGVADGGAGDAGHAGNVVPVPTPSHLPVGARRPAASAGLLLRSGGGLVSRGSGSLLFGPGTDSMNDGIRRMTTTEQDVTARDSPFGADADQEPVAALLPDGRLRREPAAGDRPRRGRPHLRRPRPELPRRAGRAVRRPGRARPPRAGRGRRAAGRAAGLLPAVVLRPPGGDRAVPAAGRGRPGRPQPGLLHHRRRRGRGDGVEGGQAVLQADRQAA